MLSVPSRRPRPTVCRRPVTRSAVLLGVAALLCGAALTACGVPPELREQSGPSVLPRHSEVVDASTAPSAGTDSGALPGSAPPGPGVPFPLPTGPLPPGPGPQLPPTPGPPWPTVGAPTTATPSRTVAPMAARCPGTPSGEQLLAAVRRTRGLLPDGTALRVGAGPFCAGSWQYAVVRVLQNPEPEPLLVVTRGRPDTLTVVAAGTNVCTSVVQAQAPAGIRSHACEVGGPPTATPPPR